MPAPAKAPTAWAQSCRNHTSETGVPQASAGGTDGECVLFAFSFSDPKIKQPSGSKHKLTKAASLPGKNGNPTFAAVTAGYDKSPGEWPGIRRPVTAGLQAWWNYLWPSLPLIDSESIVTGGNGFAKVSSNKTDFSSSLGISHTPADSDGSDRYSRPFSGERGMASKVKLASLSVPASQASCPRLRVGMCQKQSQPLGAYLAGRSIRPSCCASPTNSPDEVHVPVLNLFSSFSSIISCRKGYDLIIRNRTEMYM